MEPCTNDVHYGQKGIQLLNLYDWGTFFAPGSSFASSVHICKPHQSSLKISSNLPNQPCRCCLLLLLITAMNGAWLLEQPAGSYMPWYQDLVAAFQTIGEAGSSIARRQTLDDSLVFTLIAFPNLYIRHPY